ncbi:DUF4190 domain-containing protein [Amycolatopsis sp. AA4]|uniref:DUF4190 domain-containing protein n=1 Tax=Actinomycetes TaxID=1760 RepID=UPI0001B55F9E|nr:MULTISPECIES: DUF4190 domain-containing protein [Actinomycetes]ATY09689.1 DUF4190 domain-containing protein [Amycolatopsis sp. AA4]EFL05070.1 predicted protein [Streptomyces sp. AA4]
MTTPSDRDPAPYEPPPTADPAPYEPPAAAEPASYEAPADALSSPAETGPPVPPPGWTAPDPGPVAVLPGEPPAPAAPPPATPYPVAAQPDPFAPPPGYPGFRAPPPYGAPYQPYPNTSDSGLATGALVCSLLGLATFVLAVPGLAMGHVALSKASRNEAGGRTMALSAVVLGYVAIALWVGFFGTLLVLGLNGYLDR